MKQLNVEYFINYSKIINILLKDTGAMYRYQIIGKLREYRLEDVLHVLTDGQYRPIPHGKRY